EQFGKRSSLQGEYAKIGKDLLLLKSEPQHLPRGLRPGARRGSFFRHEFARARVVPYERHARGPFPGSSGIACKPQSWRDPLRPPVTRPVTASVPHWQRVSASALE